MESRLNIITLGVRGLDEAIRFYRDGLGWPMSSMAEDCDIYIKPLDWLTVSVSFEVVGDYR